MMVQDVYVEEGSFEVFPFYYTKFIITALSPEWGLTAARTVNHINWTSIVERLDLNKEISERDYFFVPRVGIDKFLEHTNTPDYRPGISLMIGAYNVATLKLELLKRLYALNCPTISLFDGFHKEEKIETTISVQDLVEVITGGKAIKAKMGDLIILSIPTSEGTPCRLQPEFNIKKGFMGANFMICGVAQKETLKATMSAVDAIQDFDNVFCPYPAGINRFGSIFGTEQYYPTLREKISETKIHKAVKCIYEVEVDGIGLESIKRALRAGIEEAAQVKGIKQILIREIPEEFKGKKVPLTEILI